MRPALLALAILLAAPAAGQDMRGSQGSFPVFGPSAEREAYFAAQEAERQRLLEEIRAEEAAAAEAARAREAEDRENRSADDNWLSRMPYYPVIVCRPRDGEDARECRTDYWPYRPAPFLPLWSTPETRLELHFGPDGPSGTLSYREPGLNLQFRAE